MFGGRDDRQPILRRPPSDPSDSTICQGMKWERWLTRVASAIGIAAGVGFFLGPVTGATVLAIVVLVFLVARLHVAYGRPSDSPHYTPPQLSREEWSIRMYRDFRAQQPGIFPPPETIQERARRATWRRDPWMAVLRCTPGLRLPSGRRPVRRTGKIAGCL